MRQLVTTAKCRKAVNKGGTALMTPFADESRQRAFILRTRKTKSSESAYSRKEPDKRNRRKEQT